MNGNCQRQEENHFVFKVGENNNSKISPTALKHIYNNLFYHFDINSVEFTEIIHINILHSDCIIFCCGACEAVLSLVGCRTAFLASAH